MAKCVCARQERDVVGDRAIELQRTRQECSGKIPKLSPTPEGEFPFVLGTGVDAQRRIPLRGDTGAAERCAGALASLSSGARGQLPDDGQMPPLKGVS